MDLRLLDIEEPRRTDHVKAAARLARR